MRTIAKVALVVAIATITTTAVVSAAVRHDITGRLGGNVDDFFDLNGTLSVDSLYVGGQGVGGVTFFNGTIVNSTTHTTTGLDNPVTFGDNVRIDGTIFRGDTEGPGDVFPIKLNDDVNIYGTLNVSRATTIEGAATLNGDVTVKSGQSLILTDVGLTGLLDADRTITGDWVNTANPWSAAEIADVTRKIDMPIGSLFMLTDPATIAPLDTTTTPSLAFAADQGAHLVYAEDDTDSLVGSIVVPEDYSGNGVFKMIVDISGSLVTDWNLDYEVAIGQTSVTETWDSAVDNETPIDIPDSPGEPNVITFTPSDQPDLSAGDKVNIKITPDANTAAGEPNVEIYNFWFEYTATQ
ncbi:MAG: hypothetical protein Q8Q20_05355 [bacterium]|nr:hypothetical protein [bacterium]